jgi:hypothetical protein
MKAGRSKQPIDLIQSKGKKHLTKKQKERFKFLANELCLNILSGTKVSVPKEKQEKPKNKFAKFSSGTKGLKMYIVN